MKPDKVDRKLARLKKIAPHLSDQDIHNLKEELANLFSREGDVDEEITIDLDTHFGIPYSKRDTLAANTAPEEILATQMNMKKSDGSIEDVTTKNLSPNKNSGTPSYASVMPQSSTGNTANTNQKQEATFFAGVEKQCNSCKISKPRNAFTSSQWKKAQRTGRCIACTEADIKTSQKFCVSCNTKERDAFSISQWRLSAGTGRCKECFKKNQHMPSISESPNVSKENKDAIGVEETNHLPVELHVYPEAHSEKKIAIESDGQENEEICGKLVEITYDEDVSQLASANSESASSGPVKLCFECGKAKPQIHFTASQWKKRRGTGRCLTCVSQSPQWQTGSVECNLQAKVCCECNVSKSHVEFSPNQWRRAHGTGRCKHCVKKSLL